METFDQAQPKNIFSNNKQCPRPANELANDFFRFYELAYLKEYTISRKSQYWSPQLFPRQSEAYQQPTSVAAAYERGWLIWPLLPTSLAQESQHYWLQQPISWAEDQKQIVLVSWAYFIGCGLRWRSFDRASRTEWSQIFFMRQDEIPHETIRPNIEYEERSQIGCSRPAAAYEIGCPSAHQMGWKRRVKRTRQERYQKKKRSISVFWKERLMSLENFQRWKEIYISGNSFHRERLSFHSMRLERANFDGCCSRS